MAESQPIRVLVVDDHAVVRGGLAAFLLAFDDLELVGEASGGEEAVRMCRRARPDVVLMDLVMPEMDGAAATRAIRAECPQVQVIALTSFREEELVQGALQAGAIGYLLKNVSADELADAIRKAHAGRATLAPEAAQALIRSATQPPPAGARPHRQGARGAGADGGGAEQPRHRRAIDRQPLDGQVPCEQRALQARRVEPHRGGGDGAAEQDRVALGGQPKPHPSADADGGFGVYVAPSRPRIDHPRLARGLVRSRSLACPGQWARAKTIQTSTLLSAIRPARPGGQPTILEPAKGHEAWKPRRAWDARRDAGCERGADAQGIGAGAPGRIWPLRPA